MSISVKDRRPSPTQSSARDKMAQTDREARSIVQKEADQRERKTARLRSSRLAREAEEAALPAKVPAKEPKAKRPKQR